MKVLEGLRPTAALEYFEALCAIPHGSRDTKRISDYCAAFAREHGLRYVQDAANNIVIYKPATAGYEDLKSALVLFGGLIFAAGVLLLFVRLFGDSGVPLYGEDRVPLVWSERYYPKSAASAVADCLMRHDWARLRSIAQSEVPAIRLVAYHTPDEGFVACQAFEYVELEERPLTELHIVRSGHEA